MAKQSQIQELIIPVGLAIVGGIAIWKISEGVSEAVSSVGEGIEKSLTSSGLAFESVGAGIGSGVSSIGEGVFEIGKGVGEGVSYVGQGVFEVGKGVGSGVSSIGKGVGDIGTGVGSAVESVGIGVGTAVGGASPTKIIKAVTGQETDDSVGLSKNISVSKSVSSSSSSKVVSVKQEGGKTIYELEPIVLTAPKKEEKQSIVSKAISGLKSLFGF
jgi:hypothetical protein